MGIWHFYFRPPPIEAASVEKMAYPLPDKPSIAVLPFENLSDDPAQENIVDGITDAIITGLSKTPEMFVIARNSVFTYKGKPVKVKQVSEDLGVRYVLEGSIQKEGDKLRINAQLIDAIKGHHLWAEKYDRDLKDLFALQDEITMKIIESLQLKLTEGEYAHALAKGTNNFEAYLKGLQAIQLNRRMTKQDDLRARKIWKEVIALDPNYAVPYAYLGSTYRKAVLFGWSKSPKEDLARAEKLVRKAIELDNSFGLPHRFLADIYCMKKQWDKAVAEAEQGVSIDPNPQTMYGLAYTLTRVERPEESIALFNKAFRLDPLPPALYIYLLGVSYSTAERYEEALTEYKRALHKGGLSPKLIYQGLAATYAMLGQEEEARHHVDEVLKIDPKYSLKRYAKRQRKWYKNQANADRSINALRKAGLPEQPPLPLPDKPSIAVLPFVNMSDDPKQEHFVDGITEEIITALSKVPELFVIARNSSFTYKGKPVKVQQVGRELGVKYVLEGSVRKAGDKVRVTVQLVDAKTGNHLWAERYDRELKDVFALQDEITMKVITELQVKLTDGEYARMVAKGTDNLEAYLKCRNAIQIFRRMTKEDNLKARKMFEEAIALDPNYPRPYIYLGYLYHQLAMMGWTKARKQSLARAEELARKALDMDATLAMSHRLLSHIYIMRKQWDEALEEAERAVSMDPNVLNMHGLAITLFFVGRPEESIALFNKAFRLDPISPALYIWVLGNAYFLAERYEEALAEYNRALSKGGFSPKLLHRDLAASYAMLGQEEEARYHVAEVLKIDPKFSLKRNAKRILRVHKNKADADRRINAMRKAGLK